MELEVRQAHVSNTMLVCTVPLGLVETVSPSTALAPRQ